jgi:WD40 repeat protein
MFGHLTAENLRLIPCMLASKFGTLNVRSEFLLFQIPLRRERLHGHRTEATIIQTIVPPPRFPHLAVQGGNNIFIFAWSPDSQSLAGPTIQCGLYIWNIHDGEISNTLLKETDKKFCFLGAIAWSPSGDRLAMIMEDGLRIWETGTYSSAVLGDSAYELAWSPDGQFIATVNGTGKRDFRIINARSGDIISLLDGFTDAVSWSPDGAYIATHIGGFSAIIWEVK